MNLSEEQRLKLTLIVLEALRQQDDQTPVLVGVKQPWGEYLGSASLDLSPWQFADIVFRSDLGISGFALEMNIACEPDRTLPRDLLELNCLIEQWTAFGLPLVVVLGAATTHKVAASAERRWFSEDYLQEVIILLQRHSAIQGIVWGHLRDSSEWPAGLFDSAGSPKPILRSLETFWTH